MSMADTSAWNSSEPHSRNKKGEGVAEDATAGGAVGEDEAEEAEASGRNGSGDRNRANMSAFSRPDATSRLGAAARGCRGDMHRNTEKIE